MRITSIVKKLQFEFDNTDVKEMCWCKDTCKFNDCKDKYKCETNYGFWWAAKQSLIPEKMLKPNPLTASKCDINSFNQLTEIRKNIVNFVQGGYNMYLYSDGICGNGKTSWGIKFLLNYFKSIHNYEQECKGLFINVPLFMMKSRNSMNTKDPIFYEVAALIEKVDLVVWDDLGACETKSYDYQNMLALIGIRDLSNLSNIFTGNLKGEDLKKVFDERLHSRVWSNSTRIELKGCDRRGMK